MLVKGVTLLFPDFSKLFYLCSDTSNVQLGATLVQEGRLLRFYTQKLNPAQVNYTVGGKELLGILQGIIFFEGMIRGCDSTIHTDHLSI